MEKESTKPEIEVKPQIISLTIKEYDCSYPTDSFENVIEQMMMREELKNYDDRPLIRGTKKRLIDTPEYWEKMKKQADFLVAKTFAYWSTFEKKSSCKYEIGKLNNSYTLSDFQSDFDVKVMKKVDEKDRTITYKLTGMPDMTDSETIEDWRFGVEFYIRDKGTHEQFKAAQLYNSADHSPEVQKLREKKDRTSREDKRLRDLVFGSQHIILQIYLHKTK